MINFSMNHLERSCVPNRPSVRVPFPCLGHSFSIVSWNARGLFCSDPVLRDLKVRELGLLCKDHGIIAVQEMHGSEAAILLYGQGILRSHVFLPSFFMRDGQFCSDTGGVGFLLDKSYFVKGADGSLIALSSSPLPPPFLCWM